MRVVNIDASYDDPSIVPSFAGDDRCSVNNGSAFEGMSV